MIPLLISLTGFQYQESNQLKTMMPNGSIIYCENRTSPYVSIQLILSNRELPDKASNYGYRHLLEHIVARSLKGHDYEVETIGGFLFATTSRDWLKFEWRLPPDKLNLAFKGMAAFLKDCGATTESIKRESLAISQEIALANSLEISSKMAWKSIYGENGLDPVGSKDSVMTATPKDLQDIWRQITKGSNVVISACGTLNLKSFTSSCQDVLSGLTTSKPGEISGRSVDGSFGTPLTIGIPVPSIATRQGASALVAAFGLAGRLNRPYVTYTPSIRPGVVVVGTTDPYDSIKQAIDSGDPATAFYVGRLNAMQWLRIRLSTPDSAAEFNGTLLSLSPSLRPKKIAESIELASYAEFQRSWSLMKGVAK